MCSEIVQKRNNFLYPGIMLAMTEAAIRNIERDQKNVNCPHIPMEILQEVVDFRQVRISDIYELSKLFCRSGENNRDLDCSFKTEVDLIIKGIKEDFQKCSKFYEYLIKSGAPESSLEVAYLMNWYGKAASLTKLEGDEAREFYVNNYFDFVSNTHNDELRHSVPDENGSDVETPLHNETLMKMAASIYRKMILNNDLTKIYDISRFTLEIDDLFSKNEKSGRQKKLGKFLNDKILEVNKSGKFLVVDVFISRYAAGFASIKLHVKNMDTGKISEIQINSKCTAEAKKHEEGGGFQAFRKDILSRLKGELKDLGLKEDDYDKKVIEDIAFYYQNGLEKPTTNYVEGLSNERQEEIIMKVQAIIDKESTDFIDNLIEQYHESLDDSEAFFAVGSILQTQEDAQNIKSQFNDEVKKITTIMIKTRMPKTQT